MIEASIPRAHSAASAHTYINPVFKRSFPDPFILKFRGEYFAYCTGFADDGRVFGVLHSSDLVEWRGLPGAMEPLQTGEPFYWAPEVTYTNGKFYLYYSVGNETLMAIRVAVSGRPDGGFVDAGFRLSHQDFAIDPHVFWDDDGATYMFYATDFLKGSYIGTGTVIDRMIEPCVLEGSPRTVTRAKYDWQVYDPRRKEKGGVRWHTVEGPFVLKRKGTYYEMFSGGNWQNTSYGVTFAATHDIQQVDEWLQHCDGADSLPLLRTIPGKVVGPGHNSVIRGPNDRELYCVYHRWIDGERVMAIDRMDFAGGDRIFVVGPTTSPQKAPFKPLIYDDFGSFTGNHRLIKGGWHPGEKSIISGPTRSNEIVYTPATDSYFSSVVLRGVRNGQGTFGIQLSAGTSIISRFLLDPTHCRALLKHDDETKCLPLPPQFDPTAWQQIDVEVDGCYAKFSLAATGVSIETTFRALTSEISLVTDEAEAAFSAFTLTVGFEELFDTDNLEARGWLIKARNGDVKVDNKNLVVSALTNVSLTKKVAPGDFALAINVKAGNDFDANGTLSFGCGDAVTLKKNGAWHINTRHGKWMLPKSFDPETFHQFRLFRTGDELEFYLEDFFLGSFTTDKPCGPVEMVVAGAQVKVDMVRFTRR